MESGVMKKVKSQNSAGTLFFPNKIMFNDDGVLKEYYVTRNVMKMYYNDNEVFRRVSFTPSLSLSTNSLSFKKTGGTDTVGVSANAPWSVSTSASWLTIATASTGFSVTAPDYSSGETARQATIIVTAYNGDIGVQAVVSVEQQASNYTELAWIHKDTLGWNVSAYIETNILITSATTIRIGYSGTSSTSGNDRLVGYTWEDKDIHGGSISDNHDWRIFGYSNGAFDVDSQRRTQLNLNNLTEYDLTLGDFFVYDNKAGSYLFSGTTQNIYTQATCKVDMSTTRIQFLYIYEDGVEVFHGVPAMDGDGNVGLWDEVSDTLFWNPNITMTYGEIE